MKIEFQHDLLNWSSMNHYIQNKEHDACALPFKPRFGFPYAQPEFHVIKCHPCFLKQRQFVCKIKVSNTSNTLPFLCRRHKPLLQLLQDGVYLHFFLPSSIEKATNRTLLSHQHAHNLKAEFWLWTFSFFNDVQCTNFGTVTTSTKNVVSYSNKRRKYVYS